MGVTKPGHSFSVRVISFCGGHSEGTGAYMFRSKETEAGIECYWNCTLWHFSPIQPTYDRVHKRWPSVAHLFVCLFTGLKAP